MSRAADMSSGGPAGGPSTKLGHGDGAGRPRRRGWHWQFLRRSLLESAGRGCARHPLVVFGAWVVLLGVVLVASKTAGGSFSDNVNLGGTQAYQGLELLKAYDPTASGYTGTVVVQATGKPLVAYKAPVEKSVQELASLPHVVSASDPFSAQAPAVSPSGEIAYVDVHMDVVPRSLGAGYLHGLYKAARPMVAAGLRVNYGGGFDQLTRPQATDTKSELVGFAVALVVLVVGFGSLAAAGLPLVTALWSVLVGLSLLGVFSALASFGTASPTLAAMIGLGVGIDYALFLTTRFRQRVADGYDPIEAAASSVSTSGRSVLVAACTVSVALFGLFASGINFIGMLGLAAVIGVAMAAAGALSIVPAALGLLGRNIDRLSIGTPVAEAGKDRDGWHRYAALVGRKPWLFLAGGLVVLATLAVPLLSIRLGHVDDGADPPSYTDKRAYDLISQGFGKGANGPLDIVVDLPEGTSRASARSLGQKLDIGLLATPDVAHVGPFGPSPGAKLLVGSVVPKTSPQSAATTSLFHLLVGKVLPTELKGSGAKGYVTGSTATWAQFTAVLKSKLPIIIAVVVATAFLLVLTAFRSLLLALKAALLNLVSIAAAYGVLVAVFQWGWGRGLLGVSEDVPIESYVPVLMFAIVFGLSMDYEIFLLTRVKEHWDATHDDRLAVARGLSSTGRVISCAALIMASVFAAFAASSDVVVKMLAVGLAASVVLDATVVRLLLVPAVMYLLGPSAWWVPRWLDRVLPRIKVEGAPVAQAPPAMAGRKRAGKK